MTSEQEMVKCINCKHATYKQWFQNPIIAMCLVKMSKEVAESNRICKDYAERIGPPEVEHLDSY